MILPVTIFVLLTSTHNVLSLFGTIDTNTDFHFRKLTTEPSKKATIEFSVRCKRFPVTHLTIYTTEDDVKLKKQCSDRSFGQLRNEDLVTPLREGRYRFTSCTVVDSDMLHCSGLIKIQDYIPRNYSFSFGLACGDSGSINDLTYEINITDQSNITQCESLRSGARLIDCTKFYSEVSFPNLIGTRTVESANFENWIIFQSLLFPTAQFLTCYQHLNESLCHVFYPKCDAKINALIPPCKEACIEAFSICQLRAPSDFTDEVDLTGQFDCDYLPAKDSDFPCFYKPVTCGSPPNVDSAILNGIKADTSYPLHAQAEYSCEDEDRMEGNSTITCLYSGQWSEAPRCIKKSKLNLLVIILPATSVLLLIIAAATIIIVKLKRKSKVRFTRRKKFDAFVCYSYDNDDPEFAETILRIQLEEIRKFKLCIHRRDFQAGCDIMWNIRNAIKNSNSAIIVMSRDYVNSAWCREEFEQCYFENMEDPAFRLFVIMMQPATTLENISEYIRSFLANKTYLERNDPKLFTKIADYLRKVKEPKRENRKEVDSEESSNDEAMNYERENCVWGNLLKDLRK